MILVSLIAMRLAEKEGYWLVLLISFVALPIRGVLAACVMNKWGVYPVQILDGIGAGLQSVAVPGLVAHLLSGTGRVNAGQGAVMTVQGLARRSARRSAAGSRKRSATLRCSLFSAALRLARLRSGSDLLRSSNRPVRGENGSEDRPVPAALAGAQ